MTDAWNIGDCDWISRAVCKRGILGGVERGRVEAEVVIICYRWGLVGRTVSMRHAAKCNAEALQNG